MSFPRAYDLKLACCCQVVPKVKLENRKSGDDIFFTPNSKGAQIGFRLNDSAVVALYNAAFRKIGDWSSYNQTSVLLVTYFMNQQKLEKLQIQYPDREYVLDPRLCTPIVVKNH